jgi:hypothetical protein
MCDGRRRRMYMQVTRCYIRGRCWRTYSPLTTQSTFSAISGCTCVLNRTPPLYMCVCWCHTCATRQAGDTQERDIQLPRDHPQPQDPSHPPKDVARERRQLSRAALLHALDEAAPVGGPLPAPHRPSCHRPGTPEPFLFWGFYYLGVPVFKSEMAS